MSLLQLCVCECAVILESCSALLVGAGCVISSRLARLQIGKSSLRCITALCLPAAATAPQAETLIFYSLRGKISAGRSRDRSFSSPPLHFLEEFTPGGCWGQQQLSVGWNRSGSLTCSLAALIRKRKCGWQRREGGRERTSAALLPLPR